MSEIITSALLRDANLKAYYRFSNGAFLTDSGPNNYTLTNVGTAVNTASGKYGYGLDTVDLTSSHYLKTTAFDITASTNWSFSFWVKMNAEISSSYQAFFYLGGGNTYFFPTYAYNGGTRRLDFRRRRAGVADDTILYNIALGTDLHHIALTYNGTTMTLYVEGAYVDSVGSSGNGSTGVVAGLNIGIGDIASDERSNAIYDDFAVFTRSLSAAEVLGIYLAGSSGTLLLSDN